MLVVVVVVLLLCLPLWLPLQSSCGFHGSGWRTVKRHEARRIIPQRFA
eukprot:COSAG06_NODE_45693_length_352_cov_15.205534_2_plen_47_part_01